MRQTMVVKILNFLLKKTKKYTEIALFMVLFNYKKFKENGMKNSCEVRYHPCFRNDEVLKENKDIAKFRDKGFKVYYNE